MHGGRLHRAIDVAACLLLVLFAWQALSAARNWSHTSDELPHLTSGYAYDKFGDFRLQPENGVLPQRVHGLAALACDARLPVDPGLWRQSQVWLIGWDFFYASGNPLERMLQLARTFNCGFGLGLGFFLYFVSRRWHGPAGGLVTLALFCFCPSFLFHSAQATSDVAGVLFLTLASWAGWELLARRTPAAAAWAGVAAGATLTAKFSGVLIAPILAVLAVTDAWLRGNSRARLRRLAANAGWCALSGVVAAIVVWAAYGFRFRAAAADLPPLEAFAWPWNPELHFAGLRGRIVALALDWHLLPEAYLRGLDYVFASESSRSAFFAGAYSDRGWWLFFPTLFLVKTPVALLVAVAAAGGLAWVRRKELPWIRWVPLLVPALITWIMAVHSSLNIGHRHILAVYPVLFVAAGSLVALPRKAWLLPVALCGLQAAESWLIRPHYLAYFNFLCPPERAHRLVVDSSLDWGQDLPALARWLDTNRQPGEKLYLSYFGNAWPPHYGVRPTIFLPAVNFVTPPQSAYALEPGLYCVSATSLAEVYSDFRGPWRPVWEQTLREGRADEPTLARLRFARLCKYLQGRAPDANAGHSILIYRLDAAELEMALHGTVHGW